MTNITTRKTPARRRITWSTDHDGEAIVIVTLSNGEKAKLFAEDYERLVEMGISPNWTANGNGNGQFYVRTKLTDALGWGNNAMVSRLIAPPTTRGLVLRHRDGNRLNLRRDNLEIVERRSRAKAREAHLTLNREDSFARAA